MTPFDVVLAAANATNRPVTPPDTQASVMAEIAQAIVDALDMAGMLAQPKEATDV